VNPAYEFDNLSEKQVHVGSGGVQKTAAATAVPIAAPSPATQPQRAAYEYGQGSDAALGFSRFPPRERTRSGRVAGRSGECLVSRSRSPGTYVDET
jgi:hypothetical protein